MRGQGTIAPGRRIESGTVKYLMFKAYFYLGQLFCCFLANVCEVQLRLYVTSNWFFKSHEHSEHF